jgi:aryl-alcohol dehydrogenase-like predicted oxidoreductase
MEEREFSRRQVLALAAGAGGLALLGARTAEAGTKGRSMLTRNHPRSGEALPVIGLGTWQTFDVGTAPEERAPLRQVLQRFLEAGGRVIDSSPMYGRAEQVVGELLAELGQQSKPFLATKVWTSGKAAGEQQMRDSARKMGQGRMDLMQVHNLLDWRTHLPVLREWKAAGRFRYLGITHYQLSAFDELEKLMREETLDFVQLPYSLAVREAEKRLLPVAAETGTAVLVMRPFESGALFRQVRGKSLPAWAADFDCASWAEFFLKFILGHPAVTCPIPATSNPRHLEDNLRAGTGRLPDEKTRARMVEHLGLK